MHTTHKDGLLLILRATTRFGDSAFSGEMEGQQDSIPIAAIQALTGQTE
jgi:hypothetical protein